MFPPRAGDEGVGDIGISLATEKGFRKRWMWVGVYCFVKLMEVVNKKKKLIGHEGLMELDSILLCLS